MHKVKITPILILNKTVKFKFDKKKTVFKLFVKRKTTRKKEIHFERMNF